MIKRINQLCCVAILIILIGISKNVTSQYCTPSYTNGAVSGVYISKVQLDSISDSTGAMTSPFYSFDSTKRTSLKRLQTYTIYITGGTYNGVLNNAAVFIDYTGDQDFADANEGLGQITPIGPGPTAYSITFTVPCDANLGNTRIRVRMALVNGNLGIMNACTNYGWGECQDYIVEIIDNPLFVSNVEVNQNNVFNIVKNSINQEVLQLKVTTDGCNASLPLTDIILNTNGSTDTNDIEEVRLYYTGNNNALNTTNLFNSTSLTNNISLNGYQQLKNGDNYFWLTYNIDSNATLGNIVDCIIDSVIISNQNFIPNNNNPNGSRMIDTAMILQSFNLAKNDTTPVVKGSLTNEMMMIEVVMSNAGGSVPLTSLDFNTTNSSNANNDIALAKVYYNGANNYFDTTMLFGSIANPNGAFSINGFVSLLPGKNYFWVTYDIKSSANIDDTVDISLKQIIIDSKSFSYNNTTSGIRTISNNYCFPVHPSCGNSFIQGMLFADINNAYSGCTNFTGNAFNKYPASLYTTTVYKGNKYKIIAYNSNVMQTFRVWIDYNHNGIFENTESILLTKNGNNAIAANDTATATINIPCNALSGWTNMRIRSKTSTIANTDACTQFNSGETEEYYIFISNQSVNNVEAYQASTLDVTKGWTNQQILKLAVVVNSCVGSTSLTNLNFSSNGTSDTVDIKSAKVYYTGASKTFDTTTLLGSVSKPGANFAITCNQNLVTDTNWIWLVYDIDSNATLGNYVDAELNYLILGGNSFNATNSSPSGKRLITGYMTLNSTSIDHPQNSSVNSGSTSQIILRMNFKMNNGASSPISKIYLNTKGTNMPTINISNAKLWYTSSNSSFTNATQYGTTVNVPNGAFEIIGNFDLNPGDNYFWLTYDIQTIAISNDTIDAQLDSFVINNNTIIPANNAPAGYRLVVKTYCTPVHQNSCSNSPSYIHGVKFNTINNQKSGCTSSTANKFNVYPSTSYTTTVFKDNSYYLIVHNDTNSISQAFGAWIDFNQNGSFESTEFYSINSNLGVNKRDSVHIQIPCSSKNGLTRLRIRTRAIGGQLTSTDPCSLFSTGETEDYTINIQDNPNTGWLGKDKFSCNGDSVLINPSFNFISYQWSTSDTSSSIYVSHPGVYYLIAKTLSGCTGTDSINIIASNISVNLGNDISICNGGVVMLNAGTGYASYKWSNGDTTQKTKLTTPGNHILVVKNLEGCSATDTIKINYIYAQVNLGNDTSFCVGDSFILNSGTHSKYYWNTGDTSQYILVKQAGKYKVQVIDTNGCSGDDSIIVTNKILNLGNDTSICIGKTLVLDAGNWATYSWSNGANTQTNQVSTAGNYIAHVKDIYGCAVTDTIKLSIDSIPKVNLGSDTILCNGNTLVLNGGNGNRWYWSNGDTSQSITVSDSGIISVITYNKKGCMANDSIKIVTSKASVNVGPDKSICAGLADTLYASTGFNSYQWSNGDTSWFIIPSVSGSYWLRVTNALGCSASDTVVLTVMPVTSADFTVSGANNPFLFIPNDTNGLNYQWNFGDGTLSSKIKPSYSYQTFGNYMVSLKVTSINGCEESKSSNIIYNAIPNINSANLPLTAYPNPFNEELNLSFNFIKPSMVSVAIYDLSGKQITNVFESKNMSGKITQTLDLANFANGFYVLKITIDDQSQLLKVIKNKL